MASRAPGSAKQRNEKRRRRDAQPPCARGANDDRESGIARTAQRPDEDEGDGRRGQDEEGEAHGDITGGKHLRIGDEDSEHRIGDHQ